MIRNWRPILYGMFGAAVMLAALATPAAWATPGQSSLAQSIPTRTPTPLPIVPSEPPAGTPAQPTAAVPTRAPGSPSATPMPAGTAQVPIAPAQTGAAGTSCPSTSSLTLVADRQAVWPGATVVFTATLANTGAQTLRNVVLEDRLAAGLEPVAVLQGGGSWQGATLRVSTPALPAGQRLTVVYSARVVATNAGQAITARAAATSTGCQSKTASVTLGLPPSQLPATGSSLQ